MKPLPVARFGTKGLDHRNSFQRLMNERHQSAFRFTGLEGPAFYAWSEDNRQHAEGRREGQRGLQWRHHAGSERVNAPGILQQAAERVADRPSDVKRE